MESWECSWVSCFFSKQMLWRLLKIFLDKQRPVEKRAWLRLSFDFCDCVSDSELLLFWMLCCWWWSEEKRDRVFITFKTSSYIIFFFLHNIYSLISVCLLLFCLLCSLKSFELWENNGTRHICLIPFLFLLAIPKQKRVAGWMKQWKRATCKKYLTKKTWLPLYAYWMLYGTSPNNRIKRFFIFFKVWSLVSVVLLVFLLFSFVYYSTSWNMYDCEHC